MKPQAMETIWAEGEAAPLGLAAEELRHGWERLGFGSLRIANARQEPAPEKGAIILRVEPLGQADAYRVATGERITIAGGSPRGALFGAYALLEALGLRWAAPGAPGERITPGDPASLPRELESRPAFPERCLILGHHAFLREAPAWIEWAARNRLNAVFVHVIDAPVALGAAPLSQWQQMRAGVRPMLRRRAMRLELGGHLLRNLLPRPLFRQHPTWFREHNGRRTPDYNLCCSQPEALEEVARQATGFFAAYPEADVYHIWPDDIPGGGWCSCAGCRSLSPSDQALTITNAIAAVLAEAQPAARLSFLAYHDTEAAPRRVQPAHNVDLEWAPRMRCVAHPYEDPACPVNTPHYPQALAQQQFHFSNGQMRVFEYYLDAILFKSVLPPLLEVMQADLRSYRQAGCHSIQALMTGTAPWASPQLNVWAFARLAWDPDQDPAALRAAFCQAAYGPAAGAAMAGYWQALEQAYRPALDLAPDQVRLSLAETPLALLRNPQVDMGDPFFASDETLERKRISAAAAQSWLDQAAEALEGALRAAGSSPALDAERRAFALHRAWLRFDAARIALYLASRRADRGADLATALEDARHALAAVLAWGRANIADPRYRLNFASLHRATWELRLEQIATDMRAPAWQRPLRRLATLARMLPVFVRLRGLYAERPEQS